jgi:hypothetical protein
MRRMPGIAAALTALVVWALPAEAAEVIDGKIVRYECGDNCYLIIADASGEEMTGLCLADACAPWNEQAEMPAEFVGQAVRVGIGTGQQVDGGDNVMGDFPAFTTIEFAK